MENPFALRVLRLIDNIGNLFCLESCGTKGKVYLCLWYYCRLSPQFIIAEDGE